MVTYKIENPNGEFCEIYEDNHNKFCKSLNYNYSFNKDTGCFSRYGNTLEDNPKYSPFGPEILDLEISTICSGINNKPCTHCYKSNTKIGNNMSLDTFKKILHKIPRTLTQIAFGIGDIDSNPDMFDMFSYCRTNSYNKVVPNVTINGWNLNDEYSEKLTKLCGAIAVSRYRDKDICYNAIEKLSKYGMEQLNIHMLLSNDTYYDCIELVNDYKTDSRLKNLNAIVFLILKPKGIRNRYRKIGFVDYKNLVEMCITNKVPIGFDSCTAPLFIKAISHNEKLLRDVIDSVESCESGLFSSYINILGEYWHCSFTENHHNWSGVNVLDCDDFLRDVWFNPEVIKFRNSLINQESNKQDIRTCPVYPEIYPDNI